ITVTVSRWSGAVWLPQGRIRLSSLGTLPQSGYLSYGGALYAAGLTGLSTPDFVMVTQNLDQPWFSIISAGGGRWHLVPVDFGYGSMIGVPAAVKVEGRLLRLEVGGGQYSNTPLADEWYHYVNGTFSITNPPGGAPSCDPGELGSVPLPNGEGGVPPASYACADGWALLTGTYQMSPYVSLVNWQGDWTPVAQFTGPDLNLDEAPMWYGIPLSVLETLGKAAGPAISPDVAAAAVLSRFPGSTVSGYDNFPVVVDSGVVRDFSQDWLAIATSLTPGASVRVDIFRMGGASWSASGSVRIGYFGYLGSSPQGGGLVPEALSGSNTPDFALNGGGADTHWFAVMSDIAGQWRGVPFDWVGKPTVAVSGGNISGSLVEGQLDACGCASGPESSMWYRYSPLRREFVPTNPPGLLASCTPAAAHRVVSATDIRFARLSCADGWAIGVGTERAEPRVAVLLEQQGSSWQAVNWTAVPMLDKHAFVTLTADYLVPPDVLAKLVAGLGRTTA
ncbi:MAG TPA: hypothetical protein VED59_07705, partial [Acidimicrobiales bacterium]|nr:hypothetical protein [Acidimicrobiales bacterium]